jgi:hypothetical protein
MTGMKEGAGEDPFADDTTSPAPASEDRSEATEVEEPDEPSAETATDERSDGRRSIRIPYKFRRDGVQDGRSRVPLFLQPETKTAERDALRELEERFDDDVSLTDLREALVMVGLAHLDEVEVHLEEWGYGVTFDE